VVRPLDPLRSIKLKLGVVIVAAVAVSSVVSTVGFRYGWPLWVRPLVAAAIGLAMVQLLARGMTSPLREMARVAKAMAAGDYSQRVRETSRDEVGQLARAFNTMSAELAETDRLRRDLVANVSHELRTPISALQALLENLVDGVAEPDPSTLKTMLDQAERLGRLVSQLLDLSRLEAGTVPLQRRRFAIAEVLEQAAAEARLSTPGLAIDVEVAPPGLAIEADPERVHQVVANLLENAARYSPTGSTVDVSAAPRNGVVRIVVSDEGPGIPAGQRERVFERFYRADAARSTSDGGSGLGLAIARWIVDLHGGAISAQAGDGGRGCRMVVELPATGEGTR
jgi:signal transduction histidine kinase